MLMLWNLYQRAEELAKTSSRKLIRHKIYIKQKDYLALINGKTVIAHRFRHSFSLFGISCHLKDFRFAWTINKSLSVDFKKSKPYIKGDDLEFSQYEHQLDLDTIYLFANKSQDGFLITKKNR